MSWHSLWVASLPPWQHAKPASTITPDLGADAQAVVLGMGKPLEYHVSALPPVAVAPPTKVTAGRNTWWWFPRSLPAALIGRSPAGLDSAGRASIGACRSRANADDRLAVEPLGLVEGGHGII